MSPRRWTRLAGAVVAPLLVAACAAPTDRVVLLPDSDGRASGAVAVRTPRAEILLAEPYAQATVAGGRVEPGKTTAEQVRADFGAVLDMQPARARQWVVYFEAGGNTVTAASLAAIEELRAALANFAGAEVVVTGHTDRVGPVPDNDRLSLARAGVVRDLLVAAGVRADLISISGRGERAPLVPTADEVAEPRNRRVEIKLR